MIKFTKRGRGDFGALDAGGASEDGGEEQAKKDQQGGSGDLVGSILSSFTGGAGAESLCGCANKDKGAEDAKKKELQEKYPLRNCGVVPTKACLDYNASQQARQDAEFEAWQAAKDAQVGQSLQPSDQQRFGFVASLAKELKARHPEAGGMTLGQIYKTYPDDFDAIYEKLKAQYPFLKNIPAETALAMNPGIANMTLDELIAKTSALSGGTMSGASGMSSGTKSALGLGVVAGAGLLLFSLFNRSK